MSEYYPLRDWLEDVLLWTKLTKLLEEKQGYAVFAALGGLAGAKVREATRTTGIGFLAYTRSGDPTGMGFEVVNPDPPDLINPTPYLNGGGHYL